MIYGLILFAIGLGPGENLLCRLLNSSIFSTAPPVGECCADRARLLKCWDGTTLKVEAASGEGRGFAIFLHPERM